MPTDNDALPSGLGSVSDEQRLLHELQVHQIELEAQNEELRQKCDKLDSALVQYADLYEFSPTSYFVLDDNAIILQSNLAGANLLGIERSILLGSDFRLFVVDQDKKAWDIFLKDLLAVHAKLEHEFTLDSNHGRLQVLTEGIGDKTGWKCRLNLVDITDRKLAEGLVHRSQNRLSIIADNTYEWEYWSDPDGKYLWVSPACLNISGYPSEFFTGARGLSILEIVHPDDRPAWAKHLKEETDSAKGEHMELEMRIIKASGETIWITHVCRAIFGDDGVYLGRRGCNRDITALKRAEELRDLIERTVQHNFRSPAVSAISLARILSESDNMTEEQRHLIGVFEKSGRNMIETLDMSLDLYKIETGRYQAEPKRFDCLAMVNELIEDMMRRVDFANIQLDFLVRDHPSQPHACPCVGEPKLLRMVLQNLLNNASEASPSGAQVEVKLTADNGCRIDIKNQGVVPQEIREKFFDKYATMGKKKGTGIGTYSAKMMVEAQGGHIEMQTSDEANETIITIVMPA